MYSVQVKVYICGMFVIVTCYSTKTSRVMSVCLPVILWAE